MARIVVPVCKARSRDFLCDVLIVDDPYKDHLEGAFADRTRERVEQLCLRALAHACSGRKVVKR